MTMVSRWALVVRGRVAGADLDSAGRVSSEAVESLVREGCEAYLALLPSLVLKRQDGQLDVVLEPGHCPALEVGQSLTVLVAASAVEVRRDSFTVAVRLRPAGAERPLDLRCQVRLTGGPAAHAVAIPDELRAQLIALEKAATRTA